MSAWCNSYELWELPSQFNKNITISDMAPDVAKLCETDEINHLSVSECSEGHETSFSCKEGEQNLAEREWYMNKFVGLTLIKTLNQENGRLQNTKRVEDILLCRQELCQEKLKTVSMEALLGKKKIFSTPGLQTSIKTNSLSTGVVKEEVHDEDHYMPNKSESICPKQFGNVKEDVPTFSTDWQVKSGKRKRKAESSLQFVEQEPGSLSSDDGFENMTIKEMQLFFKESARKYPRKQETVLNCKNSSESSPSNKACHVGRTMKNHESEGAIFVSLECEKPMNNFQLEIAAMKPLQNGSKGTVVECTDVTVDGTSDENSGISISIIKDAENDGEDAERTYLEERKRVVDCGVDVVTKGYNQFEAAQDEWTLERWLSRKRKSSKLNSPQSKKLLDVYEEHKPVTTLRQSDDHTNGIFTSMPTSELNPQHDNRSLFIKRLSDIDVGVHGSLGNGDSETYVDSKANRAVDGSTEPVQVTQEKGSPDCITVLVKPRVLLELEDESDLGVSNVIAQEGLLEPKEGTSKSQWPLERCIKSSNTFLCTDKSTVLTSSCTDFEVRNDKEMSKDSNYPKPDLDCVVPEEDRDIEDTHNLEKLEESKLSMASDGAADKGLFVHPKSGSLVKMKEPTSTDIAADSRSLFDVEEADSAKNQSCIVNLCDLASESDESSTKVSGLKSSLSHGCLASWSPGEAHNSLTGSIKKEGNEASDIPLTLLAMEILDTEEDQVIAQHKPAKLPCKRKAISPLSREKLLQAINSNGSAQLHILEGLKRNLNSSKFYKSQVFPRQESVEAFQGKNMFAGSTKEEYSSPDQCKDAGHKGGTLLGSPCHNKDPSLFWRKSVHSQPPNSKTPLFPSNCIGTSTSPYPQPLQSTVQRLSLVLNKSPSPLQLSAKNSPLESVISMASSPLPTKGILKSNSQLCQGPCKCEECVSLRFRAEKASEFSQRQMHDIEGLAVKLMKELGVMRTIVEEKLLSGSKTQSPHSGCTLDQVKIALNSAMEAEEMTKKWLVRMARDCNRYCKIMRTHQRKLSFADEAGGQLCHIKLLSSQSSPKPFVVSVEKEVELSESAMQLSLSVDAPSKDGESLLIMSGNEV